MQARRFMVVALMSLALGACASAGNLRHAAQADPENDDYDADKVAAVNQWAHTKGATEIWINYPQKHRPHDGG
jgi:hypothetical protein